MTNIDKQALREAAEKALPAMMRLLMMANDELFDEAVLNVDGDVDAANAFNLLSGPETMLALLDELEADKEQIKTLESRNRRLGGIIDVAEKRIAELQSVNEELKKFPQQIVNYVAKLGTSEIGSHTRNVIYRAAQKVKDRAAGIDKGGQV